VRVPDVAAARAELETRGGSFVGETWDSVVCHLAAFRDPDGNALNLHRRYAPTWRRRREQRALHVSSPQQPSDVRSNEACRKPILYGTPLPLSDRMPAPETLPAMLPRTTNRSAT
jgi:hypothetical protein